MTKKREKPLHLDMSFDEALKRFVQTDPREFPAPKPKKAKRKKRPPQARSKNAPRHDEASRLTNITICRSR
jgi:hypothetical protein